MEGMWKEGKLYLQRISTALSRMDSLPTPSYIHILQAFLGSFVGILVLSYIDRVLILEKSDFVMIVGSFGAQAVLIFATPNVPLAQPWNCIFGNSIGAVIGVSCYKLFKAFVDDIEEWLWIASALAVSVAIVVMLLTKSLHPPAGATALTAVQGSQRIHDLGYYYVLFPAVIASAIQVFLGILLNNLSKEPARAYPVISLPYDMQSNSMFNSISNNSTRENQSEEEDNPRPDTPRHVDDEFWNKNLEIVQSSVGSSTSTSDLEIDV